MRLLDPRVTTSVSVVAAGVWLGGILALGAIAAPVVFGIVPAPTSADAMAVVFTRFDGVAMTSAVLVLLAEAARAYAREPRTRLVLTRMAVAVITSALAITEGLIVTPKIAGLHRAGAIRGFGPLGQELESTHHLAEQMGKAEVVLLIAFLVLSVITVARTDAAVKG